MFKNHKLICLLLFLIVFSLSACGGNETAGTSKNETKQLVVMDWGGALEEAHKKAIYKPFEKKYGVKIVTTPADYGKLKAMVESGNVNVDVADVSSDFVPRGTAEGILEKLDYNVIDKEGTLDEYVSEYGIGADLVSTVISYNPKSYKDGNHPKTWADFWDTNKFPGKRAFWKYPMTILEAALLADGVKPENMYPLDVNRAFKSLDKIKGDVKVWWDAGEQAVQLVSNKEVAMSLAWSGRVLNAKNDGAPIEMEYNEQIIIGDSWVVPKGTKNKDLALKFIDFAIKAKQQAEFSKQIGYAPTNADALDLMSEEEKKHLGQTPEKLENAVLVDYQWWLENYDKVNERFQKWLLE